LDKFNNNARDYKAAALILWGSSTAKNLYTTLLKPVFLCLSTNYFQIRLPLLPYKHLKSFLWLISTLIFTTAYSQTSPEETKYQEALSLNKSGQFAQASSILKALMNSHPEIERYKSDYIAVAGNAKQCSSVFETIDAKYLKVAPLYVQETVFNCYLDNQPFSKTDQLARSILNIYGKNEAIELRMTTLSRERKEFQSAQYWSKRFTNDFPNNSTAWELRAGVLQDIGDRYAALHLYEELNKLRPGNPKTQQQIIQVLLDMGISPLALSLIENENWMASPDQKLRSLRNAGAVDIRWSIADSAVAPYRFVSTDAGIQKLTQALEYANSINAPADQIQAIQFDLIVAYSRRKEWDKALKLYDELISQKVLIPNYTLTAVATSYSAKHEYAKAEAILQKLYAEDPQDQDTLEALYYSLVDQDKFSEAKLALEKLTNQLKVRPKYLPKGNLDYTGALIEAVNFEAYQEKYQDANTKLLPLLSEVPSNSDLLKTAGSLKDSEGMYQAAADYFSIASKQDPQDIEARIGYANARMSQGDIPTFINTVTELKPAYSDITAVKNASERLDSFNEGYVTGNFVLGNGDYGSQKNNNRTSDLRVYSAPISDNFRGFARYRDLNSGPAIPVTDQGVGGGFQYTNLNQEAEVEIGSAGYARLEGTQTLNDNWAVGASYERNAFYLFPGSLYATYGGNVAGLDLKWKDGDATNAALGYRYWALPSNNRQQIFGTASQRLLTEYNYKVDVTGWIGNQQNTNSNVSYFSPINQTEYSGTLNFRILQWRDIATKKYDFWHRVYGSYGVVTQAGYTTLPMNNYGYGQDFNVGDKRTLSWGIGKTSFPFNGAKSSYITGYLNFESRF
jgi:poly-beta-1,6 N-acetyl-D-glucosamine export porin PgaA